MGAGGMRQTKGSTKKDELRSRQKVKNNRRR